MELQDIQILDISKNTEISLFPFLLLFAALNMLNIFGGEFIVQSVAAIMVRNNYIFIPMNIPHGGRFIH